MSDIVIVLVGLYWLLVCSHPILRACLLLVVIEGIYMQKFGTFIGLRFYSSFILSLQISGPDAKTYFTTNCIISVISHTVSISIAD